MQAKTHQTPPGQPRFWPQNWISLLIAVVCLLFLAALLFPVYTGPSRHNHATQAISNIKQLCVATHIYAADFEERLPIANQWVDLLIPYTKNYDLFRSPEVIRHDPTRYGIAFRSAYSTKPLKDFDEPDRQVMLFDSTILSRNANSGLESLPNPGRQKSRPGEGNVFGFVDTHVKIFPDQVFRESTADGKPLIK